ncbi:MAG: neutral/alkaline non-lysosomal ceramidase N-terminal domain-containing protein [Rhodopirellula sp.]|nr:neutral/alkaline non-lysosomal ceramidase N-terminal domain-containing protein [Rhodopirellula sp.]
MTNRTLATAVLTVTLAMIARLDAGQLRGGAAALDITPLRLPVSMTGGFQDRLAMQAHDRLHARCVVLSDGETRIAIVICDSCLITRDIYDASKDAASKATGIPANRILTAATHTHSAPTAVPLAQCNPDPEYVKHLTRQITQAIIQANARMQPVEVGWGVTQVPEEVGNRRWFVKPQALQPNPFNEPGDQVRTNPPRGTGLLIKAAGPVDPDVTFLSVQSAKGQPVSLLANYGLHYVGGIPSGQLSADYFGEFARQIAGRLKADANDDFVGIMSNGASGDVNNYQFPNARPRSEPFERVQAVASLVADRVAEVHTKIDFTNAATIRMNERELQVGIRQPNADQLEQAKALLAKAADPERLTMNEVYAQESLRLAQAPPTVSIKLQTIAIGELAIVTVPCEVFAGIGLEIKRRSPFKTTFLIGLANGYNGYLPTPEQHALGGYETWRSSWSYLETEASTKITASVLDQLQQLRSGDK